MLARVIGGLVMHYLATGPRRHVNFQVLNVTVNSHAMAYAPTSSEHSTCHRMMIEPLVLVTLHGDPSFSTTT